MTTVTYREARADDAEALVDLIGQLEFAVDREGVAARIVQLAEAGEPVLVAEQDGRLVGMVDWHVMPTIHRPRPVGRIVALVVDEAMRGQGVGTQMVAEVERRLSERGCEKMEVTSNVRLDRAHAFYEGYGMARSSYRFAKDL